MNHLQHEVQRHPALLNPISRCTFMILNRKNRRRNTISDKSGKKQMPPKVASEEHIFSFLESANSIPESEECFLEFISMYPAYQSSNQIDQLRSNEYFQLNKPEAKVCLDYCGFGLFSYLQNSQLSESSAFSLSVANSNLKNHALYESAAEGTAENDIKTRIMEYLNTPENEYSLVFTASRGSAFQLLAESYPFESNKKLLTLFDHESQSVNLMAQTARDRGARVYSAKFMWPSLKIHGSGMIKLLSSKKRRKRDSATGLFIFPVQSRVSGVKYAYKWMGLAKHYGWHVLLDAGSLGPKDMESFGLSLFRPDFIITSFYRVFGADPTGFGCLVIKNSVLSCLKSGSKESGFGVVRIVPSFPQYLRKFADSHNGAEEDPMTANEERMVLDTARGSKMQFFSGPYVALPVTDSKEIIQGTDSFGEIMKSPIFNEDESSDSSLWIYLGPSPSGSDVSAQLKKGKLDSPLAISWLFEEKNNSLDKSIISVSKDKNQIQKDSKDKSFISAIRKETDKEAMVNSPSSENDLRSAICRENMEETYKSAIRKETELEFMILDRREGNNNDADQTTTSPFPLSWDDDRPSRSLIHYLDSAESSPHNSSEPVSKRREPEIKCRHMDHINMIGINKSAIRIRCLVNWLMRSLLRLRLPRSHGGHGIRLVYIYGPRIKGERGPTVAFNVRDKGGIFIHPETVQKLADRNGIHLGVGFLNNIRVLGKDEAVDGSFCNFISNRCHESHESHESKVEGIRLEVVIASLGFLTNFADVYKLWAFVARFLDPSFVEVSEG
ncbi:uncharacterized protein LOC110031257 [Phalaenopsis equestris]|uniref:uncharacterized protein LOC110031257 n=1 Tax=Phalaenopsis equestris TaxID=78828 RepID=UPI0009E4FA18|nr:uncharacterized protein LOC110031257 [Phalaenopsis equestris]